MNVENATENFMDRLDDDVDIDEDRVRDELETFDGYDVPEDEAISSLLRKIASERNVEPSELLSESSSGGQAPHVDIADINSDGDWVTIRGEVVQLWDSESDSIAQAGLIDDGTDRIRFVSWEKSGAIVLAEGTAYELSPVVTDVDDGNYSIYINSATEIEIIDEEFESSRSERTVSGLLVDFESGSGLISRDSETDEYVSNENDVDDTYHDLRLKAVLDDGDEVQKVLMDRELTEELTGVTLEDAEEMAREALDKDVVIENMRPDLIGRHFEVTGVNLGEYISANEVEQVTEQSDLDSLLVKARSM